MFVYSRSLEVNPTTVEDITKTYEIHFLFVDCNDVQPYILQ